MTKSTLNVFCRYQLYPEMHAVIDALSIILIKVTESPVKSKHTCKSPLYYIRVSVCVGFFFPLGYIWGYCCVASSRARVKRTLCGIYCLYFKPKVTVNLT